MLGLVAEVVHVNGKLAGRLVNAVDQVCRSVEA